MKPLLFALALAIAPLAVCAAEPMPALKGNLFIHDPTIIATDAGWASFATGIELAKDDGMPRTKTSVDGISWVEAGAIPGGQPAWIEKELGLSPPNIWAPTISTHAGTAYLYYAASSFGKNDSVIGLMTNAAFDATKPNEGWVDQGLVIRSHKADNFNAIDPYRIDTEDGKAWLVFGSYWDGIRLFEIDPKTGLRLADAPLIPIASRQGGAIEAPTILAHDGRFYLMVSLDQCCRGVASTYRIAMGRADAITGPYLDRDGKELLKGGGTELLKKTRRFYGPGGQEFFPVNGENWLVFHYYDLRNNGLPTLQTSPLGWSADGWPELGELPK